MTIKIADLIINIKSDNKEYMRERYGQYLCDESGILDMSIKTYSCDYIELPREGVMLGQHGLNYRIKLNNGKLCEYLVSKKNNKIIYLFLFTPDYSDVEIQLSKSAKPSKYSLAFLEYICTSYIFSHRIVFCDGMILHSSALCYHNKGIAFSADSGTGKSTHVALWKQQFGDEVEVINDDKPAVFFKDSKPYLYGTPWSGKTDINSNICVPLSAIVFIERGSTNSIERMNLSDSILNLRRQIPDSFYDNQISIKTFDAIQRICESGIPIYRLRCNISAEAVQTVYKELFPEESAEYNT